MTRDGHHQSRRSFLRTTGTVAASLSTAASTGLAGCAALPDFDDEELSAPDYDEQAASEIVWKPFPRAPAAFPAAIPDARFRAHETRARELLNSVPDNPDIPNEAIEERILEQRNDLADRLGDMARTHTPRDRLGRWRYYRAEAAEVWGSYVAATDQYSSDEFQSRYDDLRSEYNAFEGAWDYRGSDPTDALVVHHAIERLVSHGRDEMLTTGPYPTDPQAAVREAGRMVQAHERAAANLADARTFREEFLANHANPPSHRLLFAAATERLRRPVERRVSREPYESALEEGPSELDVDIGRGPAGIAFEQARQYANGADRAVQKARHRNDPATATIRAARYRHAHRTFRTIVDAIYDEEITWPDDVAGLRTLRADTIQTLEAAWNTDPQHLAVELTALATDAIPFLHPPRDEDDVDDNDLAGFVGVLHYAKRYAHGIPDFTPTVVETITTE